MKQVVYDGIGRLLKSLKSMKLSEMDVEKCKQRLVNIVALLNKLDETIEQSEICAIDVDLDLLTHKLNVILHDGDGSEEDFSQAVVDGVKRNDETALYLEDILLRCKSCSIPKLDSFKESKAQELTKSMLNSQEFIMNFIHEIVWPEIFRRLDQKKKRKQLMVDLKKITSEERQMIEGVGSDCVESILGNVEPFQQI